MTGLLHRVNWVDIIALILLIRITYISSRIGVGKQILPVVLLVFILTVSLHNYKDIASFFAGRYAFSTLICRFFSYFFITVIFSVGYHIISHVTGFRLLSGEMEPGRIEKVGGTALGIIRSGLIIGMVLIGLLLMPVRFVEKSVRKSFLGSFYINASLRVYTTVANLAFKGARVSYREDREELFLKKGKYIFDTQK
ncbi:MAG: CvpA family protein [Omnitrophica bacterium]|nr:CvpA family protein [Candidatus Omnitrophota bacterium]